MQRIQNEKVGSDWGGDDGGGPPGGTRVIAAAVTMADVTPAMAFQQCSPELVSSWDGLPDESFPRALCLCCAGCLIFQIPPTSLSPYVRSLLDVLHALSHLTFMVDIVTFEVGTISLFLVGNIEVLRN